MPRRDEDDDDRDRDDEEERDRDDEEDAEDDGDSPKKKKKSDGKLRDDEKQMAMFAHLGCLVLGFLAPLIIWLTKKDESAFIERHAKEALNFSISATIIITVGLFLCGIGILYVPVAMILNIMAGLAANKGEEYQYPMTIRFIK